MESVLGCCPRWLTHHLSNFSTSCFSLNLPMKAGSDYFITMFDSNSFSSLICISPFLFLTQLAAPRLCFLTFSLSSSWDSLSGMSAPKGMGDPWRSPADIDLSRLFGSSVYRMASNPTSSDNDYPSPLFFAWA